MSVKRIKNLVKQLNEYRHAYYNQDAPLVSDAEYDRLFDELKELEEQTQINEFRGDYAFLSNFYPAPVSYMGQTYANNEAAFQAQKTLSAREQRKFCIFRMHNPSDAKKLGRDLTLRPDWEKVKVRLMYEICMCKFMQNPELRDKLLATGESTLIEGNNWGDYFWGKVNNCGENQLGIILMDVRAKLQWNAETAPNNIPQCLQ